MFFLPLWTDHVCEFKSLSLKSEDLWELIHHAVVDLQSKFWESAGYGFREISVNIYCGKAMFSVLFLWQKRPHVRSHGTLPSFSLGPPLASEQLGFNWKAFLLEICVWCPAGKNPGDLLYLFSFWRKCANLKFYFKIGLTIFLENIAKYGVHF